MSADELVERRQRMRREADAIAARRRDAIAAHPSSLPRLRDCEVCGGTGAMTARAADAPHALPAVIPCPACAGRGATLQTCPLTVVPDA